MWHLSLLSLGHQNTQQKYRLPSSCCIWGNRAKQSFTEHSQKWSPI